MAYLTLVSLGFLIYKVGLMIPTQQGWLGPTEDVDECSLAHCVSLSPTSSFGLQSPLYLQC